MTDEQRDESRERPEGTDDRRPSPDEAKENEEAMEESGEELPG